MKRIGHLLTLGILLAISSQLSAFKARIINFSYQTIAVALVHDDGITPQVSIPPMEMGKIDFCGQIYEMRINGATYEANAASDECFAFVRDQMGFGILRKSHSCGNNVP